MKTTQRIFTSLEQAVLDSPPCPKPKNGQPGHWFYVDWDRMEKTNLDSVPCICGTCELRVLVSSNADDLPDL